MVDRFEKKDCNGCAACGDVCAAGAIHFEEDALTGFCYPVVDKEKCIACGLCVKKCSQKNPLRRDVCPEVEVYAAWSKNDKMRLLCTSGGIFYEIASFALAKGGVVAACSYTEDYRGAYHKIAATEKEPIPLCGSKYVQSDTAGIYSKVKRLLEDAPVVVFVGAPCQVAALYCYLGETPENLLTVDFICNSINSPKSQAKYIDYLEEKYGAKLIYARSKDKRNGWTNFGSSAIFSNGREYYAERNHDARVVGYHQGHLFIRESCLHCQYKTLPRNADITLGDFWGIEQDARNPKLELGTSVVMANSKKGKELLEQLKPKIGWYEKKLEDVLPGNPALLQSVTANGNGPKAFLALDSMRFDQVVEQYRNKDGMKKRILRYGKKVVKAVLRH